MRNDLGISRSIEGKVPTAASAPAAAPRNDHVAAAYIIKGTSIDGKTGTLMR